MKLTFWTACLWLLAGDASGQEKTDKWLEALLRSDASPLLQHVLDMPDTFQYQLIYTQINRDKNNKPHCRNYYLHVDKDRYFNPASTVKLPVVLSALEKLNQLQVPQLNRNTNMFTDSSYSGQIKVNADTLSENGLPSIAQYIKEIFLISDNDAYNRLYEFVGQQALNDKLLQKGYSGSRITRRFMPMTEDENRHTNAIHFVQDGKEIYQQPAAFNAEPFDFTKKHLVGNAYYNRQDSLISQPMDFTTHNIFPLQDLQQMLQSVLLPQSVTAKKRFVLTAGDYKFFTSICPNCLMKVNFRAMIQRNTFRVILNFLCLKQAKPPSLLISGCLINQAGPMDF